MSLRITSTIALVALLGISHVSQAVELDLTSTGEDSGFLSSAYFEVIDDPVSSMPDFLTDTGCSADIDISAIPVVVAPAAHGYDEYYFEFLLDINEPSSKDLVSIDSLSLSSGDGGLDPWGSIFSMSGSVQMEYVDGGASNLDLRVLIPIDPDAIEASGDSYLRFCSTLTADGPKDYWHYNDDPALLHIGDGPFPDLPVPEPSSLTLWSVGLLFGVGWHTRRRRRAKSVVGIDR